ncbi:hypothetical protein P8452_05701 [Trifolium repens]|nr:hypothetical protein P8452_05701 [Trifolium repens]
MCKILFFINVECYNMLGAMQCVNILIAKNPSITQAIKGSERSSKDLEVSNDLDDSLDQDFKSGHKYL